MLWPVFSWIVLEELRAWIGAHPKLASCHAECVSVCVSVHPAEKHGAGSEKSHCSGPSGLIPEIKNTFNTLPQHFFWGYEYKSHHLVEIGCTTTHSIKHNEPL